MSKSGMAKHSLSAFNEKSAIRLLEDFLEQKHTIATFFKQNDRTPNYDGSFELVGADNAPTKQFIVQIKKVENLVPNVKGSNKGCYVYEMDTSFLYYVKEKVTESPAIYFVVDIMMNNIFWLYLSDELLMKLNFEGKERISYPFKDTDIVTDIDVFVGSLNHIVKQRNTLFLQKTPEQIAEMQDALDYINCLMENDFIKIKEEVFPNLWRFGIKYTPGETISMTANDCTMTSETTAMFALYPQIKGQADTGLKEYSGNISNYFNYFDMIGKTSVMEYTQDSLHKIVKAYFENGIPSAQLPDIMIFEKIDSFVRRLQRFYNFKMHKGKMLVDDLYKTYVLLIRYIQHIILDVEVDDNEIDIKKDIISRYNRGEKNYFDIFHCGSEIVECYKAFCEKYENEEKVGFKPDLMFHIIPRYQVEAFVDIAELKNRKVKYYSPVWTYNYYELTQLSADEFIEKINEICEKWFSELPNTYNEFFDILFEKNKYRFKGKFEYCNEYVSNGRCGPWFSTIVREYKSNIFEIINKQGCSKGFSDEDNKNGLLYVRKGVLIERFLQRKKLFYDSVRCLLYQGICKELGFESRGLSFDGMNYRLFR